MRSEDGGHIIVFNGEVYNYRELRRELEAKGERFRTGTDTEVLLRLLIRFGANALPQLNGMFAFAYLNLQARTYLVARDRLGVKPLFVRPQNGTLRFASELSALRSWPGAEGDLSAAALREYLALGYLPGDRCIIEGYAKLPPGHYLEGSLDHPEYSPRRWWGVRVQAEADPEPEAELLDQLEALLSNAVALRMRSDVPVGLLLSGGLDSGLVGSFVARGHASPLALVAGFDHPGYDEADLARETASHLGLTIQVLPLQASDLADVDLVARVHDEPFADPSSLPMLRICEAARKHAIVLLTGDGGDEAFGGYRRYLELGRHRWTMSIPGPARRLAWELGRRCLAQRHGRKLAKATLPGDLLGAVFDGLGLGRDPALDQLLSTEFRSLPDVAPSIERAWETSRGLDLTSRQRQLDYDHYLPDDILVKGDRTSMAHSVEIRSPFLDYRLVEFAARLSLRMLIRSGQSKWMLRQLASRRLPPRVAAMRKQAFAVPLDDWICRPAGVALIRERLTDPASNPYRIWDERGVEAMLREHIDRRCNVGELLWRLLVLESWLRQHTAC